MEVRQLIKQNYKYSLALLLVACAVLIAYPGEVGIPKLVYMVTTIFLLVSLLLPHLLDKQNTKGLYVFIAFLGVSSALVTPILNTPDEPVHFARSLKVASGEINLDDNPKNLLISEDYRQVNNQAKVKITQTNLFSIPSSDKMIPFAKGEMDYRGTNQYSFLSYLPQAIGIAIGKLLHLNVGFIYYLGRICNALFYAFLAVLAIKLSGRFSQLMFLGATFPMSIALSGSYNQDGTALGYQLLAVGFFLYLIERKKPIDIAHMLTYIVICALVMLSKLPFVAFAGLLIFIPKKRFKSAKLYWSSFIAIIVLLFATAIWYKTTSQLGSNMSLPNVSLPKQLHNLITQPNIYILVILKEFLNFGTHLGQLYEFGWLDLSMSNFYVYFLLLYATIVFFNLGKIKLSNWTRFGIIAVSSAIVLGVTGVMFLTWTPVGHFEVLGVQGRYYISLYILILAVITSFKPKQITIGAISDSLVLQTSLYSTVAMLLLSISMM